MGRICNFEEFKKLDEGLSTKDAKQTIKDMFDKFDGIVDDKYLKDMWKGNSTLRNLYGKELFDKAWDELVDAGTISTDDGKEWCWCTSKKKELVTEEREFEDMEGERRIGEEGIDDEIRDINLDDKENKPVDITDELTEEDAEGCEQIESPNEFNNRYRLKDGRIVDVTPSGKYLLVTESVDTVNEKLDGEELLSAKQKKLPEGLKKGIIKNLKKKKPAKDEDDDECEDKKGKKDDDDDKEDKEDKKDDSSKSDEEKYLSPKQRKLPEGLKKSIIARAKKSKK